MKATELLEAQHREVEKLFKQIEKAEDDEKGELFEELAANVVAHDAIEREIFYPACEKEMGMTELLGEALVEHGVVEFCLFEADQALENDTFLFKVKVLKEMIEHHVEEEEKELFPKVEKALGKQLLEEIGVKMEARFEKVKESDFRKPLLDNLRQVLAGTIKPVKNGSKKGSAKKPAGKSKSASA